ncbi:DUF551 domain-containing protein [Escherichia coli]|nr:DUF551 domain-containing protein [Escherichia coli]
MAEFTKERIIEELKSSTQNASGMFEISEDTICALMSMLTYAAPKLPQPAVAECYQRLLRHAHGMTMGHDWNKGTMAGHHREKLCKAVEDCRAAMLQGKSEQPQNAQQNIPENIPGGNSPVIPDGWISCSERMPVIGELNWRTSFPLLVTCEIGVIPAYYGFVSVNGDRHYGFMESLKYGDDNGNHPQTNEYGLISNVTHWMPLPEPPQEVNRG